MLRNKIDSVQYENQIQIAVYVHEMAWGTAWWGRCVVVLYDILAVYLPTMMWCYNVRVTASSLVENQSEQKMEKLCINISDVDIENIKINFEVEFSGIYTIYAFFSDLLCVCPPIFLFD